MNKLIEIKNNLKLYIEKDLKLSLNEILKHLNVNSNVNNELVILRKRLNDLNSTKNKGTISYENEIIERSQITDSVLKIIDGLRSKDLKNPDKIELEEIDYNAILFENLEKMSEMRKNVLSIAKSSIDSFFKYKYDKLLDYYGQGHKEWKLVYDKHVLLSNFLRLSDKKAFKKKKTSIDEMEILFGEKYKKYSMKLVSKANKNIYKDFCSLEPKGKILVSNKLIKYVEEAEKSIKFLENSLNSVFSRRNEMNEVEYMLIEIISEWELSICKMKSVIKMNKVEKQIKKAQNNA